MNGRVYGSSTLANDIFIFNSKGELCINSLPRLTMSQATAFQNTVIFKGQKIFSIGGKGNNGTTGNFSTVKNVYMRFTRNLCLLIAHSMQVFSFTMVFAMPFSKCRDFSKCNQVT